MVFGRVAFGYKGNMIPTSLMLLTVGIGWFAVNTTSGAFALAALLEISYGRALVAVVVAQGIVAFFGYNFVHVFQRYALPLLAGAFMIAVGSIFAHATITRPGVGSQTTAFMLTAAAAFGYSGGWSPYSGDYARYLPSNANRRFVALAAGLGVFLPCLVLEVAGATLPTIAGTRWGPTDSPVSQLALAVPGTFFKLILLGICLGAVSANVLNVYSGAMSILTLGGSNLRLRSAGGELS
jgi:NCS1 family nucleobase:cation symporter-1